MNKFPSIPQFRNLYKEVQLKSQYVGQDEDDRPIYDKNKKLPVINFIGTVKLHGTNAGININNGEVKFQSRSRFISTKNDNAGFANFYKDKKESILKTFEDLSGNVTIYGEWCGEGVQKGTALNKLTKRFVIFAIKQDDNWIDSSKYSNKDIEIYNVEEAESYSVDIDFNKPTESFALVESLTLAVENECPFSKLFGISGIGEGIVWRGDFQGETIRFKSKGKKHSVVKSKKIVSLTPETLASIEKFVDYAATENRFEQGVQETNAETIEDTGRLIGWVCKDITKEESDTLEKSGLTMKAVQPYITKKLRDWYFKKI